MLIKDYITGKEKRETPEEKVRQEYCKVLHQEYGYPKECIGVEVIIPMGSSKKRADICVYNNSKKEKIIGIIELKSNDNKINKKQLESYMSATYTCEWGVGTNGVLYVYAKKTNIKDKVAIIYPDRFLLPKYGEKESTINSNNDLIKVRYLKRIFKKIKYDLYSNTNLGKSSKQGAEMIRILFCKLYDELSNNNPLEFQIRIDEEGKPEKTKNRIVNNLWNKLKENEIYAKSVFNADEKIELDASSLISIIKELQRYSLKSAEKDVIGEAFEVFAEKQFAGEKGQFFTPRIVVSMATKMINPKIKEKILDPACGSGGFLIEALDYVLKNENDLEKKDLVASNNFFGFDKEIDLVKICKLYMVLMGDGKSNIKRVDTLKPKSTEADNPDGVIEAGNVINEKHQYDIILTNPPFGKKIKIKHQTVLENFELAPFTSKKEVKKKETPPQILFLEICNRLLKKSGKMAIVLPEGVFGNPTEAYVREWMIKNFYVKAIIDCPTTTFMPYTGTKTCVAILEKKKNIEITQTAPVFFAIAEKCGHTMRGDDIWDENQKLDEDFSKIATNYIENKEDSNWGYFVSFNNIVNDIFIPRYYDPRIKNKIKLLELEKGVYFKTIGDLVAEKAIIVKNISKAPHSTEVSTQEKIRYIRTADINNFEISKNPKQYISEGVYGFYKKDQDLKENDILFIKDGDHRIGEIAILGEKDKILVHGHFFKIRAINISPFLLFYLLNTDIVKKQIRQRVFIQSTLGTIGSRIYELKLPFYKKDKKNKEISDKFMNNILLRERTLNNF